MAFLTKEGCRSRKGTVSRSFMGSQSDLFRSTRFNYVERDDS